MIEFKIKFHQESEKSIHCSVDWGDLDDATKVELMLAIPIRTGIEKLLKEHPIAALIGSGVGNTPDEANLRCGLETDIRRAAE